MAPLDQRHINNQHNREHSASGVRRFSQTVASWLRNMKTPGAATTGRSKVPGPTWRRVVRRTAWGVATLFLALLLGFLYVTFVGITIDATFLRERIAQAFSESTGRAVRFDGAMEIEISAQPRLRVGELRIANPREFGAGEFASLGEARLEMDLWPLLFRKQLRIDELAGSDVRIRLQAKADGSNNWTLRRPASTAAPQRSAVTGGATTGRAVALLDIRRISLQRLNVEYVSHENKSHFFDLHSLQAQSPANAPLKLILNGAVEREFPYSLEFTGGILSELAADTPWPVAFTLSFLSSTLTVDGTVTGGGTGQVTFGLGTENLEEFERLLQLELPDVGASGIAATADFSSRHISVKQLAGAMGETALTGDLNFDRTGPKPRLTGALIAKTLDLRPFLGEGHGTGGERINADAVGEDQDTTPTRNLPELYRSLASASFDLRRLNDIDADITLGVERWLSLPGDVKDVRLRILLQDGVLRAPLTATMSGVTMSGQAVADASVTPPQFNLALATSDSELGGLAKLLTGVPGVRGQLGLFEFNLTARGSRGSELVQTTDVSLNIAHGRFSYGNIQGARPVNFSLDTLTLRLPSGKPLDAAIRGTLLGQPFTGNLSAGALEPLMLDASTPLDFRLRSGDVRARINGTLQPPGVDSGPDFAFEIVAPRAGEVARWFGLTPRAQVPASFSGKASLRTTSWQLRDVVAGLGRSSFSAEMSSKLVSGKPLLSLRLDAEQIDVAQLESILPRSETSQRRGDAAVLDIPLLPKEIDLADSDVAFTIKRIVGTPVQARDVSFDGRIRDGYMHPSPFAATVADAGFSGAILLDLREAEPIAGLWLYAENLDVGSVLREIGLVRDLDARFREFAVNLTARSSRLGDMLERSELLGTVGGGRVVLRDPNIQGEARITVEKGELRADPAKPVRLTIQGALDNVPVALAIETAPAKTLTNPKVPLQFKLSADAVNTNLKLTGKIARPVGSELNLALEARGNRFADFDALTGASLPPWGPWSAAGAFTVSPLGYEVNDLQLQVGESRLTGEGRIETESGRPRILVALTAPVIQLDDFKLGDWSPYEKKPGAVSAKRTVEQTRREAAEASDQAQKLLSAEMLRRQDVILRVAVEQVLSGRDKLGAGRMQARLENGRADIGPVEVEVPGGSARLRLGYQPTEQNVKVDLKVDIENFDYAVLARRIAPDTGVAGTFTFKVDVRSSARYLSEVLRNGSGQIDFAVWPENMKSGVIDLWAVNVLVALAKEVDPKKAPKINCAFGRFELNDGVMVDKGIVLDTSRIRVTAKGTADFKRETFALRARPQSKTAQFLSLATPVAVRGSFNDFDVDVSPGDVVETIARLATSIVWVPLQKLAGKRLPGDGADVCTDPLRILADP